MLYTVALITLLCPLLHAEGASSETTIDEPAPPTDPWDSGVQRRRDFLMEVNLRGRYLSVPDSILDFWFFDEEDAPGHPNRPTAMGYAVGLEYVIKDEVANGIFYVEYAGSMMDDGYWDDVEEETGGANYTDGDYIEPNRLGFVGIGADYAYELHANDWLSFLFGGGLGVAIITGELTQWNPGRNAVGDPECLQGDSTALINPTEAPAYERFGAGCGDDGPKRIPGVLPIVDINFGIRFNFSDRANLRLEGGLHDMFYGGLSTGIVF